MNLTIFNFINNLVTGFLPNYRLMLIKTPIDMVYDLDEPKTEEKEKPKRKAVKRKKYLVLHCTAGNPLTLPQRVQDYFLRAESLGGRGWSKGGYHLIIGYHGDISRFYPDDFNTNGVRDKTKKGMRVWNNNSIHISYTGGIDIKTFKPKDTRTKEQIKAQLSLILDYIEIYPEIKILGHREIAAKACPSFDVPSFLRANNIPEKNIF